LQRFVTMDETWIHHYTSETKQQSKQWTAQQIGFEKDEMRSIRWKKWWRQFFWDMKRILLIEYLEKGKNHYWRILCITFGPIKSSDCRETSRNGQKKVLFHHDNTPTHSCHLAQQKLIELRFELLPHPIYLSDLAPSDYHLFPKLKTFLIGQKFGSNEEII